MKVNSGPLRGEDVRLKNEKLILRHIHQRKGLSQSEVVSLTGLKAPTVLRIFSLLEEKGLIKITREIPQRNTERKGRKPVYYTIVPEAHYIVGIEFWSEEAHLLLVDFNRTPLFSKEISLSECPGMNQVTEKLNDLIEESIRSTKIDRERILGIGIGAPGRIHSESGEIINYERIDGCKNYPLAALIHSRFPYPVCLNNNAGVTAMNAFKRGKARNSQALFTFLIRQGCGGAFIHKGKLFSVLGKTAFEIGHTQIIPDGRPCSCGSKGCLESYVSESALLESIQKFFPEIRHLREAEEQLGQSQALQTHIRKEALYLASCARNISRILSPDSYLIMTRFPEISRLFAEVLREQFSCDTFADENTTVQVYSDVYSPLQAGFGACDLVLDRFFHL